MDNNIQKIINAWNKALEENQGNIEDISFCITNHNGDTYQGYSMGDRFRLLGALQHQMYKINRNDDESYPDDKP